MLKKIIKSEKGSGLVLALMVLLVLSVLGSALGIVTVGSHKLSDINRDSTSAYYIAEAGANMAYEEIMSKIIDTHKKHTISQNYFNEIPTLSKKSYEEFSIQSDGKPTATITIEGPEGSGNEREYTIFSTGKVGNASRLVKKPITIKWIENNSSGNLKPPPANVALAYTNKFSVGDNSKVVGDILIISNADKPDGTRFEKDENTPTINDISDYQKDIENNLPKIIELVPTHNIKFNSLPSKGNIQFRHDEKVYSDVITSNGTVTLQDRAQVEGDIITKNGDIKIGHSAVVKGDIITDNGKITLYDGAKVEGNIFTGNGKVLLKSRAIVEKKVISKTGDITLENDAEVYDLIASENSHITIGYGSKNIGTIITGSGKLNFGGNLKILGNVVTGNGDISFGNTVEINGAVITGNGSVSSGDNLNVFGTIITNSVNANARMHAIYSKDYMEKFPFSNSNNEMNSEPTISDLISSKPAIEQ